MTPNYDKIEILARMLSGYDEATWSRLKERRRATYRRAAATLMIEWDIIKAFLERP